MVTFKILEERSFETPSGLSIAISGSLNVPMHLLALASEAGVDIDLDNL